MKKQQATSIGTALTGGPGIDENPSVATMPELLSFRLHSVANLLSRGAAMRYKREFGVTLWEWRTIALLGAQTGLSLNELARTAGLDKSQVSRVVTGLTERGVVLRRADSNDARGIRLSLTSTGKEMYAGLIAAANERNQLLLATLGKDDQRALARALEKLESLGEQLVNNEKSLNTGG